MCTIIPFLDSLTLLFSNEIPLVSPSLFFLNSQYLILSPIFLPFNIPCICSHSLYLPFPPSEICVIVYSRHLLFDLLKYSRHSSQFQRCHSRKNCPLISACTSVLIHPGTIPWWNSWEGREIERERERESRLLICCALLTIAIPLISFIRSGDAACCRFRLFAGRPSLPVISLETLIEESVLFLNSSNSYNPQWLLFCLVITCGKGGSLAFYFIWYVYTSYMRPWLLKVISPRCSWQSYIAHVLCHVLIPLSLSPVFAWQPLTNCYADSPKWFCFDSITARMLGIPSRLS